MSESGMESLSSAAARIGAPLVGADAAFCRVVTDTRSLQPGDLFVALVGERFDGHQFLAAAHDAGAVGAIVTHAHAANAPLPVIAVDDTLVALQQYAAAWRAQFAIPVLGVTGSNGKTTTKQLAAAVLGQLGTVLATEGNLNNHIGVPLMLCRLRAEHRAAVIEMGANHLGEIALLASLAQPTLGIVTQAGDAHLEGFGSRDGVAQGKGELFAALGPGQTAILNAEDAYCPLWQGLAARAIQLRFGKGGDVRASEIALEPEGSRFTLHTPSGSAPVRLPLVGAHNVLNALAAAAAGHALGMAPAHIAAGLAAVHAPKGRVAVHTLAAGQRVIDDSYNANPTSLRAAMDLLALEPGKRLLVLGNMAELGPNAADLHAEAGRYAHALGLDGLLTIGALAAHAAKAFGAGGESFADHPSLIAALAGRLGAGEALTILIKGSRSAGMDRVSAALLSQAGAKA